jgi:hypothetical protein
VVNSGWSALFNVVEVEVLGQYCSDHNLIQVSFSHSQDRKWSKRRTFQYEAGWAKHKEQGGIIKQVWRVKQNAESPWQSLQGNLSGCRRALKQWVRKQKYSGDQVIQEKLKEHQHIQMPEKLESPEAGKPIKEEIHFILEQEDLKWRQRAKEAWLQFGDRNTKYFHACATQKKQRSQIMKIKDLVGQWCHCQEDIEKAFVDFYTELFTAGAEEELNDCLEAIDMKVSMEMNRKLLADFTQEEIVTAMQEMSPIKAPGPDGFSASFYQSNWSTVQLEVCTAIFHFLNTGEMDTQINNTHIALIPKGQNPVSVNEFRPISLCNVIYKLISKVLANRLKVILPTIISCTQSAFILCKQECGAKWGIWELSST